MSLEMTPSEIGCAIRAYLSKDCAACGMQKHRRKDPFCHECMNLLPWRLLEQFNRKEDYIAAFGASWEHLSSLQKTNVAQSSRKFDNKEVA